MKNWTGSNIQTGSWPQDEELMQVRHPHFLKCSNLLCPLPRTCLQHTSLSRAPLNLLRALNPRAEETGKDRYLFLKVARRHWWTQTKAEPTWPLSHVLQPSVGTRSMNGVVWWDFWVLVRILQESKTRVCDLCFFTELFWDHAFVLLPGIVNREWVYFRLFLITIVICISLWKNKFPPREPCLPHARTARHLIPWGLRVTWVKCPMLWINTHPQMFKRSNEEVRSLSK